MEPERGAVVMQQQQPNSPMSSSQAIKRIILVGTFILITTAVVYGAVTINDNIKRLKATKVDFGGVKMLGTDIAKKQVGIAVTLNITNTSDIDIHINGYKLDIYINGTFVAPILSKQKQTIKAAAVSPISFNVYFSPDNLKTQGITINTILTSLANIASMKIKIDGYLSVGILGIDISNYPVQLEETLSDLV